MCCAINFLGMAETDDVFEFSNKHSGKGHRVNKNKTYAVLETQYFLIFK